MFILVNDTVFNIMNSNARMLLTLGIILVVLGLVFIALFFKPKKDKSDFKPYIYEQKSIDHNNKKDIIKDSEVIKDNDHTEVKKEKTDEKKEEDDQKVKEVDEAKEERILEDSLKQLEKIKEYSSNSSKDSKKDPEEESKETKEVTEVKEKNNDTEDKQKEKEDSKNKKKQEKVELKSYHEKDLNIISPIRKEKPKEVKKESKKDTKIDEIEML